MIISKYSDRHIDLCFPGIRSHLTVGEPVASGIL